MVDLHPYQLSAVKKMKSGCILKGGVGFGKSRTALAFYLYNQGCRSFDDLLYLYFLKSTKFKPLYIITTAHKRDSQEWEKELGVFFLSPNNELNLEEAINFPVIIDSWNNIRKYEDAKDSFFIFDEQRIVGSGAWVKSFLKISSKNEWILLSATPGDRWIDYIPVFVANGYYRNRTEFIRRHVVFDRFSKYPKVSKYIDTDRLYAIKNDIVVDMDYDHKIDTTIKQVICNYDSSLYKQIAKTRFDIYKNEPIRDASGLCYCLRRCVIDNNYSRLMELNFILHKHAKALVFYNYDYELNCIKENVDFPYGELNGHRHDDINDLNSKYDHWVYLVQYNSGSEGWNCLLTDTIIFFSLNYSYRMMKQASGRINRMNTPFTNLYYYLLYTNSDIDKSILKALKGKKSFNERKFVTNF